MGHLLPISLEIVEEIPEGCVASLGMVGQWSSNEKGKREQKIRVTHDLSQEYPRGSLINNRTDTGKLEELSYGHCLLRLIHYVVVQRFYFPDTLIGIDKYDIKSAYKRATLFSETTHTCVIMCKIVETVLAFLALRMAFGGAGGPFKWCPFSEILCDIANDLLHCPEWDPEELHSTHVKDIELPCLLPCSIPFAKALPLDVDIPPDPQGLGDNVAPVGGGDNWMR